ncbi:MAG: TerB family tellurite resistance protein [Rhizobiaceae bacterium]
MNWLADEPLRHEQGFDDHDIQVCVAALFYHMIAVDGEVTEVERQQLHTLLSQRYQLTDHQLGVLEQEGEASDKDSAGLFPFTVILNRQLDEHERWKVYGQLKQLAEADGTVHDLEQGMLDHVNILLKLDPN